MLPEARLEIVLGIRAGAVAHVQILSTRLVQASRLFSGRQPEEVLALLPTVFSLCGTAQALAGIAALEAAGGIDPAPPQVAARRLLLLAETVSEHGLGLARDWPALIGRQPNLDAARRIKTAMATLRPALYPEGDWRRPGGGALIPNAPRIAATLDSAQTVLAELRGIADPVLSDLSGLAKLGAAPFLPMPPGGPPDLAARLQDDDGAYVARPDCAGQVFETGPLARHHAHPQIAALLAEHGNGLGPRMVAHLVEMAEALREMALVMQDLTEHRPDAAAVVQGAGIGMVEAARGQLAHRVELKEGRVIRYQILAPTEWNFHPDGPLARGLIGAEATPDLERRAALLVQALDPCVACTVTVQPV